MTIRGEITAIGMREARARWRSTVTRVIEGQPILVLRDQKPSVVLLQFDEVQRWRRVEDSLATVHGLEIYPELARSTAELAAIVGGTERPSATAVRTLARRPRAILGALRTMPISDAPRGFAALLDEIESGRLMTIVVNRQLAVTLVPCTEYDRLRALALAVHWFRAAGLDLTSSDPDEIQAWVAAFRARPAALAAEATGA